MSLPVTDGYGLGLRLSANAGGVLVGHGGSMPGFMASLFVDPGSGIGAAVLTNATTGIDAHQLAMDLIDGDFIDDVPDPWVPTVTLPPEVEGVPGLWFWGNSAHEARWHNGGLDLTPLAAFGSQQRPVRAARRPSGRRRRLPPGRDAPAAPTPRRDGGAPRVRDLDLHAHAVRPGGADPRRTPGPPVTYIACETLDMLKSGTRRAGVAVREK